MNDPHDQLRVESSGDAAPIVHARSRWSILAITTTFGAWLIIAGVIVLNLMASRPTPLKKEPLEHRADFVFDLQGRYLIGAGEILGPTNKSQFLAQLPSFETGEPDRRAKTAILAGELGGPSMALERIQSGPTHLGDVLERLYGDYVHERWDAPSITPSERETLRRELGWFGKLAQAPAGSADVTARNAVIGPARRTFVAVFLVAIVGFALVLIGALCLLLLLAFRMWGVVHGGVAPDSGAPAVWAESFAIYLLIFIGLAYLFSALNLPIHGAVLTGVAAIVSLLALLWPLVRGMSWEDMRRAIGLHAGRGLLQEIGAGIATYVMVFPFIALGLLFTFLLIWLVQSLIGEKPAMPSHPAAPMMVEATLPVKVMILALAAVIAPVVEESMFRGVLYRHLRDITGRLGSILGAIVSVFAVSFVFAAIHPQGWLGIPALMCIAFALNIAREWRDSLIASMVAHGLNNGIVMTALLVIAG